MIAKRQRNDGLRKICKCPLRNWARCSHPWYFSYKPKGAARVRISLDRHVGKHIESIDDAKTIAAGLRTQIAAGEYPPKPTEATPPAAVVTFAVAAHRFLTSVPVLRGKNQGKPRGKNDGQRIATLCAWTPQGDAMTLGQYPAAGVTEDLLEAFVTHLRARGRAAGTVTKYLQDIKALDRWMAKKGYRPGSVLSGESAVLRRTKGTRRDRRLVPDTLDDKGNVSQEGEEKRLLKAANPWLQRLIIAAIETACRRGELLGLQWANIELGRGELTVLAETNKTGEGRRIPISPRLRSVLEMLRLDPAGKERPSHAYVFGNAIGEAVDSTKKGWEVAVLKAHGHEPKWTATKGLTAESRAALRAIDLHFHDLRHEAGSRMLEAGWPLHHVQRMLGHADVKQTATYLNAENVGLHDSMKRFGTTPSWQSVAKAIEIEQRHDSQTESASEPQPTIN
jgi:integrase